MPGLQSKWAAAAEEPEIKQAAPEIKKSSPKPATSVLSKWASAEPEEDEPKKELKPKLKKRNEEQVPTPPQSSETGEVLDLARSFGDRLGVKDEPKRKSKRNRNRDTHRDAPRQQRGAPNSRNHEEHEEDEGNQEEHWEDVSDEEEEDLFEDKLYEKGPMTDAAKSLAMRIGAPAEEPKAPKGPKESKHRDHKESKDHREHKEQKPRSKDQRPARESQEPKGKYMTPKQKKLLEEKQKQEKLKAEQAEKERKIKEEVRQMFELMEDKSTNWADIDE
ncbi:hypothetical protein C7M61_002323 [Candidozyma pseudohaemuli]|uniref:Uncharacterized protein n=1 Tax=Candidozyma pseudohaemuli TaxID=418784 RepID=A0A2P7YSS0_9ASCO|nr:hypothetical protein C7M61_002323 [[Candida] pseudohaemulonii]PSK39014.1 hypothetical protein C7M61_002323 [[Candida] pseudohaemulonii]